MGAGCVEGSLVRNDIVSIQDMLEAQGAFSCSERGTFITTSLMPKPVDEKKPAEPREGWKCRYVRPLMKFYGGDGWQCEITCIAWT